MKDLRNPIERRNFTHPAGNTMTELKEAELNNFAAGAGEPRNSGGMFCTSTTYVILIIYAANKIAK